jgi:hypothetical protein
MADFDGNWMSRYERWDVGRWTDGEKREFLGEHLGQFVNVVYQPDLEGGGEGTLRAARGKGYEDFSLEVGPHPGRPVHVGRVVAVYVPAVEEEVDERELVAAASAGLESVGSEC